MSDGYKDAPFGIIPKEWDLVQLNSLIQLDRPITYGIVQPGNYDANGKFLVRGKDYSTKWSKPEDFFRVSEKVELPYKRARLKTNDLIITIVGYVGKTQIVPAWLEGANITQTTARIAIDESKGFYRFFYHVLCSHIGKYNSKLYEKGGAQQGLNLSDVKRFLVPVPSLNEQRKIAEILSTVDEKIEVIDDQITQTQELKKGLMQQLLTRGIGHTQFKDSPLGEIPESWEIKSFEDETDLITCGVAATPKYVNESIGVPFLSAQNVQDGKIVLDKFKYIPKHLHQELTKNNQPKKGDILYSRVGAKFGEAGVVEHDFEFSIYVSLTLIKVKKSNDVYFIKQLLNSEYVKNLALRSVFQGAGVPNLNVKVVRAFKLPIPPKEEQIKIAAILNTVDQKIEILQCKRNYYQKLKTGLMQQLLTGKLRVNHLIPNHDTTQPAYIPSAAAI